MWNQHHSRTRLVREDSRLGSRDYDSRGYRSNQSSGSTSNYTYDNKMARQSEGPGRETDMDRDTDRRTSETMDYKHSKWYTPHGGNGGSHWRTPHKGFNGHNRETDMDRNVDRRRKSDTPSYIHPKELRQQNGHDVDPRPVPHNGFNGRYGHGVNGRQQYRVDDRNSDQTIQTQKLSQHDSGGDLDSGNSVYHEIDTFYRGSPTKHLSRCGFDPQKQRPPVREKAQFEHEDTTYSTPDPVSHFVFSFYICIS